MSIQSMYCDDTEIDPQLADPTLKQKPLLLLNGRVHSIFHKLQSKRFFFVGLFVRSFGGWIRLACRWISYRLSPSRSIGGWSFDDFAKSCEHIWDEQQKQKSERFQRNFAGKR